ncbi:hypothetical protein EXIGLDRAFT_803200, partial [Exidia glandulosa HHB12029]
WQGHDHPESFPLAGDLDVVELVVEETVHYTLSNQNDVEWASTAAAGYGYCRLGPDDRLFILSMFHELHCLRYFNYAFDNTVNAEHRLHCLSYLRHSILCSPDLTLEPDDFVERDFTTDRVGETHECRDWSAIYAELDENWERWNGSHWQL